MKTIIVYVVTYRKRQKLRERKVSRFNGICHDVGKTFVILLLFIYYFIIIIINGSVKDSVLYNHTITLFNYV